MKKIIIHFLYSFKIPAVFRFFNANNVVLLAYHRVSPIEGPDRLLPDMIVRPDEFRRQMEYLKQNYSIIALHDLPRQMMMPRQGKPLAVVTFDDAYADNHEYAFPVLRELGIPATIFVPTGFIESDRSFFWDEICFLIDQTKEPTLEVRLSSKVFDYPLVTLEDKRKAVLAICHGLRPLSYDEQDQFLRKISVRLGVVRCNRASRLLTWDQMRDMARHRIFFGVHTHGHCALAHTDHEILREEIRLSRQCFAAHLNDQPQVFAYPFGTEQEVDQNARVLIKEEKFLCAVTMCQGLVRRTDDLFTLKRIGLGGEDSHALFHLKISGLLTFLSGMKRMICRSR